MKINIKNEYGLLKTVLMASIKSFKLHPPINKTQEYYYKYNPPRLDLMIQQQQTYVNTLKKFGINIVCAPLRHDCTNQINTRDVGFVIGDSFIISHMKKVERQYEYLALEEVVKNFDYNTKILRPHDGFIEGGDVILDNDRIFIGISERTNYSGYNWLKENFGNEFSIIPIELNENYLHLDVVFNILSGGYAIVDEKGIKQSSLNIISEKYEIIFVDSDEQNNLATNVLSLSPDVVVCDYRNKITNHRIKELGKDVIELNFDEISKIGGSFRCSVCPLFRE